MSEVALLAVEELHHLRAGDILGDVGVDARQTHTNRAEVLAHEALEDHRDEDQRRDDDADDQRELPVSRRRG